MSWKLEICCDCEHKFEDSDFEKITKTFIQDVEKICEQVIFWCLIDCLIFADVIFVKIINFIKNDNMFSSNWTD